MCIIALSGSVVYVLAAVWFCSVMVMESCKIFSFKVRSFWNCASTEYFSPVAVISGCQCKPCGLWIWRDVQWFSALGLFCGIGVRV